MTEKNSEISIIMFKGKNLIFRIDGAIPYRFSCKRLYSSNEQKMPLDDIGLILCGLKLEKEHKKGEKEVEQHKEGDKEENKDEEESEEENEDESEEKKVHDEEDDWEKKFSELMSGDFRRRNEILCRFLRSEPVEIEEVDDLPPGRTQLVMSTHHEKMVKKLLSEGKLSPSEIPMDRLKDIFTNFVLVASSTELAVKLAVVLKNVATKGPSAAMSNIWDKFSLHPNNFVCMSKDDYKKLINFSDHLKIVVDLLVTRENEEKGKGGGKAGGEKKEEEEEKREEEEKEKGGGKAGGEKEEEEGEKKEEKREESDSETQTLGSYDDE
ncbi:hypothetical protein LguiA_027960 [Lonicera macranthoides]